MHIDIKATNIELTPEIRALVEDKIGELDKFLTETDNPVYARVEVGRTTFHHQKGDIYKAEINLTLGGKLLRTQVSRQDLNSALSEAKDELAREIKKAKKISFTKKLKSFRILKKWRHAATFWRDRDNEKR